MSEPFENIQSIGNFPLYPFSLTISVIGNTDFNYRNFSVKGKLDIFSEKISLTHGIFWLSE